MWDLDIEDSGIEVLDASMASTPTLTQKNNNKGNSNEETILSNTEYRNKFMDNMMEVHTTTYPLMDIVINIIHIGTSNQN